MHFTVIPATHTCSVPFSFSSLSCLLFVVVPLTLLSTDCRLTLEYCASGIYRVTFLPPRIEIVICVQFPEYLSMCLSAKCQKYCG